MVETCDVVTYRQDGLVLAFMLVSEVVLISDVLSLEGGRAVRGMFNSDMRLDRLAGDRSGSATLLGPSGADTLTLLPAAAAESTSSRLARVLGDSCGIMLARLFGRSTRTGPI